MYKAKFADKATNLVKKASVEKKEYETINNLKDLSRKLSGLRSW